MCITMHYRFQIDSQPIAQNKLANGWITQIGFDGII